MQDFMETIVKMGIFMICAQMLIHFRPDGSYEKYIKLLVGVMVIWQIFSPLAVFFSGEGEETDKRVEWFEEQMEQSRKKALENADEAEELLNAKAMEELKRKLEEEALEESQSDIDRVEIRIGEK